MRPSTSWFSEASTITRVSRIASRLGSRTASRSATHFGWGVTCTDIGSPPRALELWKKASRAGSKCSAAAHLHKFMRPYNLCEPCWNGCERRYRFAILPRGHDISSSNIFPLHRITWRTHDEIVRLGPVRLRLWAPGFLLGRTAGPPPSLVRVGGHEVRHSETAQGQAPPWLRGDEGAGRAAAWLLFAVSGHGVSHAAVA